MHALTADIVAVEQGGLVRLRYNTAVGAWQGNFGADLSSAFFFLPFLLLAASSFFFLFLSSVFHFKSSFPSILRTPPGIQWWLLILEDQGPGLAWLPFLSRYLAAPLQLTHNNSLAFLRVAKSHRTAVHPPPRMPSSHTAG
ncbi:hypothetical protein IF1G_02631 [Cordyceps javanica]|uniref:Uncharacterized protein n=1 Tax=Cordyceps javanica TaxID=43265 RepID=A0A545V9Z4_9HYPO|nr:hypothetical protein IF1G_02631 [Cordyceps javanica]TQW09766.1 hypothetical protein IF2G_02556 [Cordyceps javanica]